MTLHPPCTEVQFVVNVPLFFYIDGHVPSHPKCMMSLTFLPRVSNDNPFIESLFKTLKYRVNYPLRFRDIDHTREWMASFVSWYNTEHLHSAIGHVTPQQLRSGEAERIFERRNAVMQQARAAYPERWGHDR